MQRADDTSSKIKLEPVSVNAPEPRERSLSLSGVMPAGLRFGPYQVLAKLKAGGMASLFLGRRLGAAGFRRHVAIKVVHEHLASDRGFVRMFVDEALLQSRIQHPNVVHVEELGEVDGRHFIAMEYVHGCSIAQLMAALAKRDRRLMPDLACNVAAQVAAGLHAAHELRDENEELLGVVHRDVSPQNVLLAYEGHVKLIDFGVAKANNRQTHGGTLKGKIRYMAPEQAFGRSVDRRSDVYALGILMWEMLTLRRCFYADDDLALLEMVRDPNVEPPSQYATGISAEVDAVVMKALAPNPAERFQTAHEMRRAIADAVPGSMAIDATDLADLLAVTMGEEIERERLALPDGVSAILENGERRSSPHVRDEEEVLETMTASAAGAEYLDDGSGPQYVARSSGVRTSNDGIAPPTSTHRLRPAKRVSTEEGGGSARRRVWIAGAAIVMIGLATALGVLIGMRANPGVVATPIEQRGVLPLFIDRPVASTPTPEASVEEEPARPAREPRRAVSAPRAQQETERADGERVQDEDETEPAETPRAAAARSESQRAETPRPAPQVERSEPAPERTTRERSHPRRRSEGFEMFDSPRDLPPLADEFF